MVSAALRSRQGTHRGGSARELDRASPAGTGTAKIQHDAQRTVFTTDYLCARTHPGRDRKSDATIISSRHKSTRKTGTDSSLTGLCATLWLAVAASSLQGWHSVNGQSASRTFMHAPLAQVRHVVVNSLQPFTFGSGLDGAVACFPPSAFRAPLSCPAAWCGGTVFLALA